MLGKTLVVGSYVIINEGCPLAIKKEGTDHLQIACGNPPTDGFEMVVQRDALQKLIDLSSEALREPA